MSDDERNEPDVFGRSLTQKTIRYFRYKRMLRRIEDEFFSVFGPQGERREEADDAN